MHTKRPHGGRLVRHPPSRRRRRQGEGEGQEEEEEKKEQEKEGGTFLERFVKHSVQERGKGGGGKREQHPRKQPNGCFPPTRRPLQTEGAEGSPGERKRGRRGGR